MNESDAASAATCPHLAEYDPLDPVELRDPYLTWAQARHERPVLHSERYRLWFLTRHDDVLAAVRDTETFSSAFGAFTLVDALPEEDLAEIRRTGGQPDGKRFLVTTDAPAHTARRKLAQRSFTPRRVRELAPLVGSLAEELVDGFVADGGTDLHERFDYALTTGVIGGILGLPRELWTRLRQGAEDLLVTQQPSDGELPADVRAAVRDRALRTAGLARAINETIAERRAHPRDDVISGLTAAREDGTALEDADILALIFEVVLAGTDTTANLIAHMVIYATPDRTLWTSLASDPDGRGAVIEETLRRHGSSKGLFRRTTRDVTIAGTTIPKGEIVQLLFASANHDESRYPEPRRFEIDRPEADRHLAFGRGTHFCLGAPLARLESDIALATLSRRLPRLRLDPEAELSYLPTISTHTLAALPVIWR